MANLTANQTLDKQACDVTSLNPTFENSMKQHKYASNVGNSYRPSPTLEPRSPVYNHENEKYSSKTTPLEKRKNGNWIDKSKPLFQQVILSPESPNQNIAQDMSKATKKALEDSQKQTLEQTVKNIVQKKGKKRLNSEITNLKI